VAEPLKIRSAIATDADAIHELHTKSVQELCAEHYTPEQIAGWLKQRTSAGYLPGIERNEIFVAEAHFDQHRQTLFLLGGGRGESLRERNTVERIDAIEQARGAARFIALQMSDEMPGHPAEARELRLFYFPLLNAVLAEVSQAGLVSQLDQFGWKGFGDCDDGNVFRFVSRSVRSARDALAHALDVFCNKIAWIAHGRDSNTPQFAVFWMARGAVFPVQFRAFFGILRALSRQFSALLRSAKKGERQAKQGGRRNESE